MTDGRSNGMRPYAYCCNQEPKFCDCAKPNHGTAWYGKTDTAPTGDLRPEALRAADLADALDCFWNAAIGHAKDSQDGTTIATACAMAEGFAAVAARLRAIAARDEALASAQPAAVAGDDRREKVMRLVDQVMVDYYNDVDVSIEATTDAILALFAAPEAAALERAAEVAEANKLHWARKVWDLPPGEDIESRRIYSAKSAACFQVEMDIRALKPATPARLYTEADMAAARAEGEQS